MKENSIDSQLSITIDSFAWWMDKTEKLIKKYKKEKSRKKSKILYKELEQLSKRLEFEKKLFDKILA